MLKLNTFFLSTAFLAEKQHTNVIVFGPTQPGLDPMIYHTPGEHYTTITSSMWFSEINQTNMWFHWWYQEIQRNLPFNRIKINSQ